MDYKNLLKLAELVYNGKKHSSLANYSFSPMEVHFNSHASSEVAKYNTKLLQDHQIQSKKYFLTRLSINLKLENMFLFKPRNRLFINNRQYSHQNMKLISIPLCTLIKECFPMYIILLNQTLKT